MRLLVRTMAIFKLTVKERDPKKLGAFLLKNGFSRQALNKSKHHQGMILVNHKRRYTSYSLKKGDEVIFVSGKEKENPWLKPSYGPLKIVKENKDYLVVNKDAGILSIPSRYEDDDAVVNRMLGYFENKSETAVKPHVITRLDRNTSGLVLVGKNPIAHARFSKLSKDIFIKKYHAIVHGNFALNELTGIVDKPIGKISDGVKRGIVASGQSAQTKYRVLDQVRGASLVELQLLTGRTHQIRVHMQSIGHILYGDELYGAEDDFGRQALNCFYLRYPDPFGDEEITIKIDDPLDMQRLWMKLKS